MGKHRSAIDVDAQGHIWVADKCGTTSCTGRTEHPVMELDASGKVLRSFGSGLFASPHGIHVDAEGNVWVTDAPGPGVAGGTATSDKGQQVMKFSPDGKLLLTLGKAGVMGTDTETFNQPADVAVAQNGDIFVADGHGNARIVKFSKDGRFIKEWGKKERALASSTCHTRSSSIPVDVCSSATEAIAASRSSIRRDSCLPSGGSSAGRAASSST